MESRRPAGVPKRSVLGRTPRMIWLSIWGHATSPPEDMTDLGAMQDLSPALLMRQSRWHGRFLDLHNEVAYQRWHGTHWKSRLQFALFVSGFASLVSFFTGTTATSVALKADMMRAYPDKAWLLYLSRTQITDVGCAALAAALDSGALPALEQLFLFRIPASAAAKATVYAARANLKHGF